MKTQIKLLLFMLAVIVIAGSARGVRAQSEDQNPSQTIQGINPSLEAPTNPTLPGVTGVVIANSPLNTEATAAQPRARLSDRQLTAQIRAAISQGPNPSNGPPALAGAGISVTNLRITTIAGKVVLRGFVRSEKEKADIGARAAGVAGEQNVVNEMIIR